MFAEVIVDYSNNEVDKVFDYLVPDTLVLQAGQRVIVPFGKTTVNGFVLKLKNECSYDISKVKPIKEVIDAKPIILPEMLALLDFMVDKYHLRKVDVLRLFLPSEMRSGKVNELTKVYCEVVDKTQLLAFKYAQRLNAKNIIGLCDYLLDKEIEERSVLAEKFTSSAINKLKKAELIKFCHQKLNRAPSFTKVETKKITKTIMQENALQKIKDSEKPILLFGVTGSGKTEVYMSSIEEALKQDKTAIMLVPEISLTPQVFSIFKKRFGDNVAIIHSGLSAGERFDEWNRILNQEAKIVVGARSAIFSPVQNLGIIIIDEEHDSSYSSESNPRFNTHEVALFRQKYNNCKLIFGSATPDIKSFNKALNGEYELVEMPTRANGKKMPSVKIIDMLSEIRNGNNGIFSHELISQLKNVVENKKQAMIFINRRGYSSFMRCNECGYIAKCDSCDVSLVYHKEDEKLKCHYCGKRYRALTHCPECKSPHIREGAVGTQKVVEKLQVMFPDVKILRMDNDTTANKNSHQKIIDEFRQTKPAILVGTQMIAKGHDFKDVVLVGIVDADQSLYQSDYRSTEKTYQLITQVAGRAGRDESEGEIVLQTYSPRHYIYKFVANYNYRAFFDKEINLRKVTKFPPFTNITRVLFSGKDEEIVKEITKMCYTELNQLKEKYKKDFVFFDVMKSPIGRIKSQFRYQILMRFICNDEIIREIFEITDKFKNGKVNVFVENNPQNLS